MKFRNHYYILVTHIVIHTIILLFYFTIIGLISVIIPILFLFVQKYLRKYEMVLYTIEIGVFTLIPFSYTTKTLLQHQNIHYASLLLLVNSIVVLIYAIMLVKVRKESIFNIKNRYTDQDKNIRIKSNNFASISLYTILLPQILLILYLDWIYKISIGFLLIVIIDIIIKKHSIYIGRKYRRKQNECQSSYIEE